MSYRKTSSGNIEVHDWPPVRQALTRAYPIIGEAVPEGSLPQRDWNLVAVAIGEFMEARKCMCGSCARSLMHHEEIRCLDCKMIFCPRCAEAHFWPHGRPNR